MKDEIRLTAPILILAALVVAAACSARNDGVGPGGPAALERILDDARGQVRAPALGRVWIGEEYLPIAGITRVERRKRRGTGAWPGAAVGAVLLGTAGWAIGGIDENPRGQRGRYYLSVSAAAAGAVAGYLVGRRLFPGEERWVEIWAERQ